jgi:O-antigen ligase
MEKIKHIALHVGLTGYILGLFLIDVVRVLPSISMIILCLLGIVNLVQGNYPIHRKNLLPYLLLSASFLVIIPSVLYSSNLNYFAERAQILLPFLLLPLAFSTFPTLQKSTLHRYLALFVAWTFIVSLKAFIYYLFHQAEVNQLYLESKVMPTLVSHHPTFSMMIVMAIYICYYLIFKTELDSQWNPHVKKFLGAMGLFLYVFIHIYSVRSGLMALYALIGIIFIQYLFLGKELKKVFGAIAIFLVSGAIILMASPTVRNKITNTTQDIQVVQSKGSANNQSLASRMISYQNALQIAKESSIWMGCGLGDIEDLNNHIFKTQYPDVEKKILPHNQFLFYYAAIGLLGLLLFILTFYGPLFVKKLRKNSLMVTQYIIISLYFMVEAPLENQLGVGFTLLFLLLPLQSIESEENLKNI